MGGGCVRNHGESSSYQADPSQVGGSVLSVADTAKEQYQADYIYKGMDVDTSVHAQSTCKEVYSAFWNGISMAAPHSIANTPEVSLITAYERSGVWFQI